jgi:hypothetical protein
MHSYVQQLEPHLLIQFSSKISTSYCIHIVALKNMTQVRSTLTSCRCSVLQLGDSGLCSTSVWHTALSATIGVVVCFLSSHVWRLRFEISSLFFAYHSLPLPLGLFWICIYGTCYWRLVHICPIIKSEFNAATALIQYLCFARSLCLETGCAWRMTYLQKDTADNVNNVLVNPFVAQWW